MMMKIEIPVIQKQTVIWKRAFEQNYCFFFIICTTNLYAEAFNNNAIRMQLLATCFTGSRPVARALLLHRCIPTGLQRDCGDLPCDCSERSPAL